MMLNQKGIKFIHNMTRPLAVATMEAAAEAIANALEGNAKGPGKSLNIEDDDERQALALHLAWLIGFDTLTKERAEIHRHTSMLVEEEA
jgi:hypothetical protein